jgi:hypothetical protein
MKKITTIIIATAIITSCNNQSKETKTAEKDTVTSNETVNPQPPNNAVDSMNQTLAAGTTGGWHVLTAEECKKDRGYRELEEAGLPREIQHPMYVSGDFNGDGQTDYAVIVSNGHVENEMLATKLAVLPAGNNPVLINENIWVHTILKVIPKGTTITDSDQVEKKNLKTDAVEINSRDSGGYYLVWNGKEYEVTFQEG